MLTPNGTIEWPRISSPFGPRDGSQHDGIDLTGIDDVRSILPGTVTYSGWLNNRAGYTIYVDHGDGVLSKSMHLAARHVGRGARVAEGQHIGDEGKSGNAKGRHLHFELWHNGRAVDPYAFINARLRPVPASAPPNTTEEYPEMFYAVLKATGSWFLVLPQGNAKPRAVVLGANAIKGGNLPVIEFEWQGSIDALRSAVDGI